MGILSLSLFRTYIHTRRFNEANAIWITRSGTDLIGGISNGSSKERKREKEKKREVFLIGGINIKGGGKESWRAEGVS